jgi:membrane-associated protease RseP (regulator of RpoE activity)
LVAFLLGGDYARALPAVSSLYTIMDMQRHQKDDAVRFLVAEPSVYHTFPKLLGELAKIGMVATARRARYVSRPMPTLLSATKTVENGTVITVSRVRSARSRNRYFVSLPAVLFFVTLAIVFADGLFWADSDFAKMFIHDPLLLASVYTMSLLGILSVHEMGHMIAAKWHGVRASWPYFIPGIPGLFPTFGAMIQIRSSMTNRNVLFDVGIAGPIAGLLVAVIVSIYGASISVTVTADRVPDWLGDFQAHNLADYFTLVSMRTGLMLNTGILTNSSILMMATLQLTGNAAVPGTVLVMSPVLFAAWIGFLITFLNLLPAWQLDGGHLARSTLGVRWHRILTYSSVGILAGLGYFVMALFVLFFASRAPESTPLDDMSPLSRKRKALFWVAIALAVLCAPLPAELFTLWA